MLVLDGLVGLQRPFNFSFFRITGQGTDLDYCDIEWFALETNRHHSVVFEIASKYCISNSLVDHGGYSISSEGFLPTVVHIMVILVKFTHSSPFSVQFSRSGVSDSLQPHESQHTRPQCSSPSPRVHSDAHPSSQ